MKRLVALLLAVVCCMVCCMLCGCRSEDQRFKNICYQEQPAVNLNYNNTHISVGVDWLTKEAVYFSYSPYNSAPLGPLYHCMATADGAEQLTKSNCNFFTWSQAYGNTVYLLEADTERTDGGHVLRTYDLKNKRVEEFGAFESIQRFFVVGEYFYAVIHGFSEEEERFFRSFIAVSLTTKERKTIAPSVYDAGVVDGQPVFVVQEDGAYSVHAYDAATDTSRQLGAFDCAPIGEEWSSDMANFTSEAVILVESDLDRSRLLQYHWETDTLTEHTWNVATDALVAYEQCAFALEQQDGNAALYRICLADGDREKLADIPGLAYIFVTSDTDVYVSSSESGDIVHYNSAGERETVCSFE